MKTSIILSSICICFFALLGVDKATAGGCTSEGGKCTQDSDCCDANANDDLKGRCETAPYTNSKYCDYHQCYESGGSCHNDKDCCGNRMCEWVWWYSTIWNQWGKCGDADITKVLIPSGCHKVVYDVALLATPKPHFYLIASKKSAEDVQCPPNLAFDSSKGGEKIMFEPDENDLSHESIKLGSAKLSDILDAENKASPIDPSAYDFLKNSCAHYAQDIWRSLGFDETTELAEFFLDNIIDNNNIEKLLKSDESESSLYAAMVLSYGGEAALKEFITKGVYDQLNIIDVKDEMKIA